MPYSHHSHSGQFCKHASGRLEDVVLEAIRQGFEVYGLTEHVPRYRMVDLYPEEEENNMSVDDLADHFPAFVKEAHRLRTLYASRISLLVGLETEYITAGDLEKLEGLLYEYRGCDLSGDGEDKEGGGVSYIVGSVHHVNGIPIDFDRPTYERALASISAEVAPAFTSGSKDQLDRFLSAYFDAQYALLLRFRPEIIGHIDLCRLYTPALRFRDYPQAHARLVRNIQFAAEYGALFEVNAAALRKGWETPYPGEDVVELILAHGGRFALSDDSHGPHAVGLNYTRAADYLLRVGVSELWFLHPSEVPNASGRHVCAIKAEGKWWEHAFWDSRLPMGENR